MSSIQAVVTERQAPRRAPKSAVADPHAAEMAVARKMLKKGRKQPAGMAATKVGLCIEMTLTVVEDSLENFVAEFGKGEGSTYSSEIYRVGVVAMAEIGRMKAKKYREMDTFMDDLWQVGALVMCARIALGEVDTVAYRWIEGLERGLETLSQMVELCWNDAEVTA